MTDQAKNSGIYYILAIVFLLLGVFVSWVFLLFLPMFLITIGLLRGRGWALGLIALTAAAAYLAGGGLFYMRLESVAVLAACLLAVTFVMMWVVQKKVSFYGSVLASCGMMLFCVVLVAVTYQAVAGMSIAANLESALDGFIANNVGLLTAQYNLLTGRAMTEAQVAYSFLSTLKPTILPMLLMFATIVVSVFGLLNYTAPHGALKKRGVAVGPAPAFSQLSLPQYSGIASFVMLVVILVGQNAGLEMFNVAGNIVLPLLYVVYFILGLSFLEWWLPRYISSKGGRVALYVAIGIFLGIVIVFVGVFEQAAKMRKRSAEQQ